MEITDFMGLLLPKSFTTDRLAKFISVSILSYFSGRTKIIPCPEAIIFH